MSNYKINSVFAKYSKKKRFNINCKIDYSYDWQYTNCAFSMTKARFTSVYQLHSCVCKNCGVFYHHANQTSQQFCSHNCANKYTRRKVKENNIRTAIKLITNNDVILFKKKYEKFVYSLIYAQKSICYEDLIDWYCEHLPVLVFYSKKGHMYSYLRKSIPLLCSTILSKKSKEIGYDDCGIATQMKILGECNER